MVDVGRVLAELAGAVAQAGPSDPLPLRMGKACARIFDADGAAITLSTTMPERLVLCATDETAARLEDLQEVLSDGPSHAAFRLGRSVLVVLSDETDEPGQADGTDEAGWPRLRDSVIEVLGPTAILALPMRPARSVLGVLMLYQGRERRPFRHSDDVRRRLANAVGAAVLHDADVGHYPRSVENSLVVGPWYQRARIHQATGMVVAQLGLSSDDAAALLRAHAYAHELTLDAIADQVLARALDFRVTDDGPEEAS